jgi:hypothetical protein
MFICINVYDIYIHINIIHINVIHINIIHINIIRKGMYVYMLIYMVHELALEDVYRARKKYIYMNIYDVYINIIRKCIYIHICIYIFILCIYTNLFVHMYSNI